MKILFLTSALENVASYWRAFYLGRQLAAQGHTVFMVALGRSVRAEYRINNSFYIYLLPSLLSNEKLGELSVGASIPFQTGFNVLYQLTTKMDVLHVFDHLFPQNAIPLILARVRPLRSRPILFIDWDDWWGRGGILEAFHKRLGPLVIQLLTFLEEKIPLYADGVTIPNDTIWRRALSVGVRKERLFLLPNGTNVEVPASVNQENARGLVNLPKTMIFYSCVKSSFDFVKSRNDPMFDLLNAHKTVISAFPNAFLGFIGRGSEKCLYLAHKLGIDKNVMSFGWQPADKYNLYLAASDFLVLPLGGDYKWTIDPRSTQRLYDFIASGRPVVASETPEIKKMLEDYGLVAKLGNSTDLASKIMSMISDLDMWKKRARNARTKVDSWQDVAQRLEEYYDLFTCARSN